MLPNSLTLEACLRQALDIRLPWSVQKVELKQSKQRLRIDLHHAGLLACSTCGPTAKWHDARTTRVAASRFLRVSDRVDGGSVAGEVSGAWLSSGAGALVGGAFAVHASVRAAASGGGAGRSGVETQGTGAVAVARHVTGADRGGLGPLDPLGTA